VHFKAAGRRNKVWHAALNRKGSTDTETKNTRISGRGDCA